MEVTTETVTRDSFFGQYVTEGAGSGVIISSDDSGSYIITCAHVIEGATNVYVKLKDGTEYQADTTASDCDYAKLSRVYSQMSDVYYRQYLMQDYLHSLELSIRYAWMADDTLQALREYAFQAYAYNQLHQTDTALFIIEKACDQLLHHGWEQLAAGFSLLPVAIILQQLLQICLKCQLVLLIALGAVHA